MTGTFIKKFDPVVWPIHTKFFRVGHQKGIQKSGFQFTIVQEFLSNTLAFYRVLDAFSTQSTLRHISKFEIYQSKLVRSNCHFLEIQNLRYE